MAELLGRAGLVAVGAQAADIAFLIRTAAAQRHDVVRDCGFANDASASAVPAERFNLQAPQPLSELGRILASGVMRMRQQSSFISSASGDSSLAISAAKSVSRPRAEARVGGR